MEASPLGSTSPPQYRPPQDQPVIDQAEQRAEQDRIGALQERSRGDTASILSRYGQRLALAGTQSGTASGASPGAAQSPLMALMMQVFKSQGQGPR